MEDFQSGATGYSNLYTLAIRKGAKAYRYEVAIDGVTLKGMRKSFTTYQNSGKPNYGGYEKSTALYHVINLLFTENKWPLTAVYDNCSVLYTPDPLPDIFDTVYERVLTPKEINHDFFNGLSQVVVVISPIAILQLDDPEHLKTDNFGVVDISLTSFLELLTTQPLIDNYGFDKTTLRNIVSPEAIKTNDFGIHFKLEVTKGVNLCQPDAGKENPVLKVGLDVRVSAYYESASFATVFRRYLSCYAPGSPMPYVDFTNVFKGVQVCKTYYQARRLRFDGFTPDAIGSNVIRTEDGNEISHEAYFAEKYGIKVDGSLRAVKVSFGKAAMIVPVEALMICPYQRFPTDRYSYVSGDFQTQLLKENVMKPEVRKARIDKVAQYLFSCATFFAEFDVKLVPESNRISFNICRPPRAGDQSRDFGKFQVNRYVNAAMARRIVILFFPSVPQNVLQQLTNQLYEYAKRKGMTFPQSNPTYEPFDNTRADLAKWREVFERLSDTSPSIVIYVDRKSHDSHNTLKLMEHEFDVLTQHLCVETISKRIGGQTMDNIMNKMNEKLGGTNYAVRPSLTAEFSLELDNTFFIGYDVAHPAPKVSEAQHARFLGLRSLHPSTVGISANAAKGKYSFIGNYFYQESRSEAVDGEMLKKTVKQLLTVRQTNRPSAAAPEYVFILRDGVSEGQYRMVMEQEFPHIKKAFAEFNSEIQNVVSETPKFVMMIVTKRHMKRFFNDRGGNVDINSCLSEGVAKGNTEAYLTVSARPIMGTAKPPEYTVLHDDTGSDLASIRATVHSLCSAHQIITAPVGLPEPVFISHELAKRGNNNLKTFMSYEYERLALNDNGCLDVDNLNATLTYSDRLLLQQHYNA